MFNYFLNTVLPTRRPEISDEEWANILTHGLGVLLILIGLPILLYSGMLSSMWYQIAGLLIFGLSLLLVYTVSTIYHLVWSLHLKHRWRIADHISIYFLIAGTHTPLILYYLNNSTGMFYLILLWSLVAIGVLYKLLFFDRFELLSVFFYLALGWMAVFTIPPMLETMGYTCLYWIIAGGLSYTLGIVFYLWQRLRYHHAIWHLFVLGGSFGHFMAVWECVSIG